ncbi:hypothetical protein MIPYR_20538 [uncultured Microbacterium sp.]|uniref:Uncharacterized protein n=1 Tax=uncultured Microbacterium sp. TaxID=191216 RepID=A0A1Y5P0Y2_9MICO|nr:hypothetical protein MIPYR_20538 [uncultured Microbacterium sp.]
MLLGGVGGFRSVVGDARTKGVARPPVDIV